MRSGTATNTSHLDANISLVPMTPAVSSRTLRQGPTGIKAQLHPHQCAFIALKSLLEDKLTYIPMSLRYEGVTRLVSSVSGSNNRSLASKAIFILHFGCEARVLSARAGVVSALHGVG